MRQLLAISFLFVSSCASRQARSAPATVLATEDAASSQRFAIETIVGLEDRRSLGDGKLMDMAINHADAMVRERAFWALGRIQDPHTAGAMTEGLSDSEAQVREKAAFAIGLLGLSWVPLEDAVKARLTRALTEQEAIETRSAVKLTLIEAMGRVATAPLIERLVDLLNTPGEVSERAAISLGVAARTRIAIPQRAFPALGLLLKSENPLGSRFGAAYALAQTKNPLGKMHLAKCANDEASEVRALCAKGLGDTASESDVPTLKRLLDDADYRVAVEATRSLGKLSNRCKAASCPQLVALGELSFRVERLLKGDATGGGQPLLALAQQKLPPASRALLQSLRAQLVPAKSAEEQNIQHDAAKLDCRLAAALDRLGGTLQLIKTCGFGLVDEIRRYELGLQVLGDAAREGAVDRVKLIAEIEPLLNHSSARVKLAAVELLGELKNPAAQALVRKLIATDDVVLSAAAAAAAAKLGDKSQIAAIRQLATKAGTLVDVAPTIAEALATLGAQEAVGDLELWLKSPEASIRQSAAEALSRLKGEAVTAERVEFASNKSPLPSLPQGAKLVVITQKGEFEISLFETDAPLTAANLYGLAQKGYFRGLTFHRVVPDFVAQGGDPRGDGNGGPGYAIRCEVNRKLFRRGVVGMALSGKDTGGSQFFITTAPQPHLDGRYTTFGEVTQGHEVVDALLEGDPISDIRALP